jgi:hypothetical protein
MDVSFKEEGKRVGTIKWRGGEEGTPMPFNLTGGGREGTVRRSETVVAASSGGGAASSGGRKRLGRFWAVAGPVVGPKAKHNQVGTAWSEGK